MPEKTLTDWQSAAAKIQIDGRAFLNGQRSDSLSGETRPTMNPANGKKVAEVAYCDANDADQAVKIARGTFDSGVWAGMAPADRKMILVRWAELIENHADEIALLETLDVGKPIADTLNIDVSATVRTIRWSGEAIDKVYDEISPTPSDCLALVTRVPLGVVTAIVPWNFPLLLCGWGIAPALAAGNTVVVKPAEDTPLTTLYLARMIKELGFPDGVVNVVPGLGEVTGAALSANANVSRMSFTGSPEVGRLVAESCGRNLVPVKLELGGKGAAVVFDDVTKG